MTTCIIGLQISLKSSLSFGKRKKACCGFRLILTIFVFINFCFVFQ